MTVAPTRPQPADGVWLGLPVDAPDWQYGYVFTFEDGVVKAGIVQCTYQGAWVECGGLSDIDQSGRAIRCSASVGNPESSLMVGHTFEFIDVSQDAIRMRMTCDLFDSRFVILQFTKPMHNQRMQTDAGGDGGGEGE